jgi:hypothetical protein
LLHQVTFQLKYPVVEVELGLPQACDVVGDIEGAGMLQQCAFAELLEAILDFK